MNRALVQPIADAVLYEGYVLYPYRPSVKNRQRWTFGGLLPEAYCRERTGSDASFNQTECLIVGGPSTVVEATVRFLHLTDRQVGAVDPPLADWSRDKEPPFRPVASLRVGERQYHTWQEAEEREVSLGDMTIAEMVERPFRHTFRFLGGRRCEPLREANGEVGGVLVRTQQAVEGVVDATVLVVAEGLFRLRIRVANRTPMEPQASSSRDAALLRSLVSTHAVLGVRDGAFVSLLDPPESYREAAASCRNIGVWPVLIGEEGRTDTMLSSPIILYDYPRVAPESAGDFFDGTEIDEMLTLRVLTLTDDEKSAMAALDERAGALLARTEASAREQLLRLHGTVRGLRPLIGDD